MNVSVTGKTVAVVVAVSIGIVAAIFIAAALWGALMVN